eukprot:CAMPEP_0172536072 /NCGR_PEP_ID=MMETSP1067-20121228/7899_1 /TAXON_ID=265564 ORGANISM="Thalassiosira punctigera, Strain Tpunct2005C2" /NCGR_SAMPLE_ID=MMETSP1067 /ASSEMBLY_ACC=CAM_ASM_000444 /LENGTH=87 /DNA_ID=CAMNT_0013321079 /DNA_START=144 /DNA_END=404 /DNA_ORIENTATION=-
MTFATGGSSSSRGGHIQPPMTPWTGHCQSQLSGRTSQHMALCLLLLPATVQNFLLLGKRQLVDVSGPGRVWLGFLRTSLVTASASVS